MVATSPGHRAHSSHAGPAGVTSSTGTGQANLPQQLRLVVELLQAHPLPMRGETTAGVEPDEFGARGESGCSCSQLAPILHPTHFKEGLTFFSPPLPTPSPKLHPSSSNGARTPRGPRATPQPPPGPAPSAPSGPGTCQPAACGVFLVRVHRKTVRSYSEALSAACSYGNKKYLD